jgi:hypothetical protein
VEKSDNNDQKVFLFTHFLIFFFEEKKMRRSRSQENKMSSATTLKPIRGGPFTINLLNRILAFAASSHQDVLCIYTLVCKQWREAELYYCQEMWRSLAKVVFNGHKIPRAFRWSHWTFVRRLRSAANKISDEQLASELNEIENCGLNNNRQQQDEETSTIDFNFRCPILARHLRILENEVVPFAPNRNVLWCDVCQSKVFPVKDKKEMDLLNRDKETGEVCVYVRKNYDEVNKYLANSEIRQIQVPSTSRLLRQNRRLHQKVVIRHNHQANSL